MGFGQNSIFINVDKGIVIFSSSMVSFFYRRDRIRNLFFFLNHSVNFTSSIHLSKFLG